MSIQYNQSGVTYNDPCYDYNGNLLCPTGAGPIVVIGMNPETGMPVYSWRTNNAESGQIR